MRIYCMFAVGLPGINPGINSFNLLDGLKGFYQKVHHVRHKSFMLIAKNDGMSLV